MCRNVFRKNEETRPFQTWFFLVREAGIAAEFSDKDTRVERAIRTAICACWDSYGRDELNKMAGYTLEKRPTNLEFIDLVAAYIRYILDR